MFINDNAWESSHKLVKLSQTDRFSRELWSGEFRHQIFSAHKLAPRLIAPHIIYDSVKSTRVYTALSRLHRKFIHFLGKSRRISGHRSHGLPVFVQIYTPCPHRSFMLYRIFSTTSFRFTIQFSNLPVSTHHIVFSTLPRIYSP